MPRVSPRPRRRRAPRGDLCLWGHFARHPRRRAAVVAAAHLNLSRKEAAIGYPYAGLGGDWIFLAHHKSGTTVGEVLARQICEAHGRELKTHTFREAMAPAGKPACYFLIKAYLDDVGDWLDRAVDTQGRVVHIVRDPSAMVLSGYAFHRRGSEKVWTDTRRCSRDACDAHGAGAGLTKGQAAKVIFNGSVRPWLRAYGCAANSETYYACLRGAPAAVGLEIESRRAYATLRTMVAIHELLAPRPEYRAVCLEALRPEAFQDTVAELLRWLVGAEDSGAQSAEEIVANVTRACFDEKVHAISTHDERGDAAIDAATAAWRAKDGTPRVRELASRLKGLCGAKFTRETLVDEALVVPSGTLAAPAATWAGGASAAGKTPAFVREGKYANLEAHSRAGIVMCAAPRILDDAVRAVLRIRATGSELPIEVWHVAELDAAEIASIETSATGVKVLDLTSILRLTRDDEWVATRGFMCKPLALLATSLDEVVIVDSDSHVFADPAILLESEIYRRTGMLLFRDRHTTRTVGGSKVHSRGRYVRDLMQRRLNGVFGGKSPWRPSAALRASWMAAGESNHEIDSSIMLLHKSRNAAVVRMLRELHVLYRHEMYDELWGDKETLWLACELVGGVDCGVSPLLAGEIGEVTVQQYGDDETPKSSLTSRRGRANAAKNLCVHGFLLHFDPTLLSLSHCNCKEPDSAYLTHISSVTVYERPPANVTAAKRHSGLWYVLGHASKATTRWCAKPGATIGAATLLQKMTVSPNFDDTFCDEKGRGCSKSTGICDASKLCAGLANATFKAAWVAHKMDGLRREVPRHQAESPRQAERTEQRSRPVERSEHRVERAEQRRPIGRLQRAAPACGERKRITLLGHGADGGRLVRAAGAADAAAPCVSVVAHSSTTSEDVSALYRSRESCVANFVQNPFDLVVDAYLRHYDALDVRMPAPRYTGAPQSTDFEAARRRLVSRGGGGASARRHATKLKVKAPTPVRRTAAAAAAAGLSLDAVVRAAAAPASPLLAVRFGETYAAYLRRLTPDQGLVAEGHRAWSGELARMELAAGRSTGRMRVGACAANVCVAELTQSEAKCAAAVRGLFAAVAPANDAEEARRRGAATQLLLADAAGGRVCTAAFLTESAAPARRDASGAVTSPAALVKRLRALDAESLGGNLNRLEGALGCPSRMHDS